MKKTKLPKSDSIQELAEFCDTHNLTDFDAELEEVDEPVFVRANEVRFYRASGPYGYLSNLYACSILFEGRAFPTAEHAYQFGKPRSSQVAEWLMAAPSASLCAQAAHALLMWQVCADWNEIKVDRMRAVLHAKFEQHPRLRSQLIGTGEARLIEESTTDAFWGIGKKGNGKNMLGQILMELRTALGAAG